MSVKGKEAQRQRGEGLGMMEESGMAKETNASQAEETVDNGLLWNTEKCFWKPK